MQKEVLQLLDDYVFYREQTTYYQNAKKKNPYLKALTPTPERLRVLEEMVLWCRDQGIPPRQWLYSLFVVRAWNFAPSLTTQHLLSKKHLKRFNSDIDYDFYAHYIRKLENLKKVRDPEKSFDPNRDISQTAENAKLYYLKNGGTYACRKYMLTATFGYHPASEVCQKCPDSDACLEELRRYTPFDVLALRLGKISTQEAKRQAFARL
jgi:hypothetical protein